MHQLEASQCFPVPCLCGTAPHAPGLARSRVKGGLIYGIADGLERRLGILAVPPCCAAQLGQQLVAAGQMGERRLE